MASSSENIAKSDSMSLGWICRSSNRFVVRQGKCVNAVSMVIQMSPLAEQDSGKSPEVLCAPRHGQLLYAQEDKAIDHFPRHISYLPAPGQTVEHGIEHNFRLQARQGSAQAEMDATPEGDVTIGLALNVEAIGIWELGLVAVRRADPGYNELIRPDALVAEHRLGCRNAHHSPHRRVIAQGLLDDPRHQRTISAQALHHA